jgi:hypothetical protein
VYKKRGVARKIRTMYNLDREEEPLLPNSTNGMWKLEVAHEVVNARLQRQGYHHEHDLGVFDLNLVRPR